MRGRTKPMSPAADHEELEAMLPAAALEILDSAELQQVLAHARECAECADQLGEYRAVTAALGLLPRPLLDAGRDLALRARLMARVSGEPPARHSSAVARWTGWAAAAVMAGVLVTHHSFHRPLDYGWLVSGALSIALVVLIAYALIQRSRASALRDRVAALERQRTGRDAATATRAESGS